MRKFKLLTLAIFALGIVTIELVFGAWISPDRINRLNLVKNQTIEYDVSKLYETQSPTIKYSRDKYALRGTYGEDPARIELLTVGGSTTDQRYISDGSTWQDVLQQELASAGTPTVVANAGVDGQSTVGHIKDFDWWFPYVPHLKPHYILFYVGLNDVFLDSDSIYDALMSADQRSLIDIMKEKSVLWYVERTVKGMHASKKLRIMHNKIAFSELNWTSEPLQKDYSFVSSRLESYAQRLRILVERTRRFGSEPIFVTQPTRQFKVSENGVQGVADTIDYEGRQINSVDYYHISKQFNQVMGRVAHDINVLFIDLASQAELQWVDDDFYDYYHSTPKGARKVAHYMFEGLKPVAKTAALSNR